MGKDRKEPDFLRYLRIKLQRDRDTFTYLHLIPVDSEAKDHGSYDYQINNTPGIVR